jgi:hypothetical protein
MPPWPLLTAAPAQSVPDGSKRRSSGHWPGLDLQCVAPCMIIYMEVQGDGKDSLLIDGWRIDGEILQTGYIDKIEMVE